MYDCLSKFVVSRGKEVEIQNVHLIRQSPTVCTMTILVIGSVPVGVTGQVTLKCAYCKAIAIST